MDWLEKYVPKKIDDFIGNKATINNIITWLDAFEENKLIHNARKKRTKSVTKPNLLLSGPHGIGKSKTMNIILNEKNYMIHPFNHYVKGEQTIKNILDKLANCGNILSLVNGEKKRSVVLIESIESITATTDKGCIINLLKLNDLHWYCPIILLSNGQHAKLLSEIKKISLWVKMLPLTPIEFCNIINKISNIEKINLSNIATCELIIEHSQFDIRRLINILHDIKFTYGTKMITTDMINEYTRYSQRKDIDFDLFRATESLLYDKNNINECLIYYESEKVLLPLMIHQYYVKSITSNLKSDTKKILKTIETITDSMSYGDVIENCIYSEQNWDISEIHGYHTCAYPSYVLSKELPKNMYRTGLRFAENFNNTNIKQINKKNILNTSKCFKNMTISDFMFAGKLMRGLLKNNKVDEYTKIMKKYNVKTEHLESLLRIDKIKNTKTSLSSKQKRDFNK